MSPFSSISEQYGTIPVAVEKKKNKSFRHKIGYALSTIVILSQLLIACGSESNNELRTCTIPLTNKTIISAGDATFSNITLKHDNQVNKFSMINKQGESEIYEAVLNHDVWVIKITNWKNYFAGFVIYPNGNDYSTNILTNKCSNKVKEVQNTLEPETLFVKVTQ